MNTLGDRIKFLRTRSNMSQLDFANLIDISRSNISKIEANLISPSADAIKSISSKFEVSADWLLTGDGNCFSESKTELEKAKDVEFETYIAGNKMRKRDKENLKKILTEAETLMFDGDADILDEDDMALVLNAMKEAFKEVTEMNKRKKTKK